MESKFINKFNVVASMEQGEVVVDFYHMQPTMDKETAEVSGLETYDVCSIVMTPSNAAQLAKIIFDCITDSKAKTEQSHA